MHNYFTFKEDRDACLVVKGPSEAEQLNLLTRKCPTGSTCQVCQHMDSVKVIFEHLKVTFG